MPSSLSSAAPSRVSSIRRSPSRSATPFEKARALAVRDALRSYQRRNADPRSPGGYLKADAHDRSDWQALKKKLAPGNVTLLKNSNKLLEEFAADVQIPASQRKYLTAVSFKIGTAGQFDYGRMNAIVNRKTGDVTWLDRDNQWW